MSKKTPAAPPAPDYAAANEAAINADIATLPRRRLIESQARLGQGDFAGLGDADLAQQLFQQDLANAPAAAEGLLKLQQQYGPAFAEQARRSLEATDPVGFNLRDQLGNQLRYGDRSLEALANQGPAAPSYEQISGSGPTQQMVGSGPSFQSLSGADAAQRVDPASLPEFSNLAGAPDGQRVNLAGLPIAELLGNAATMGRVGAADPMQRFNATPSLVGVGGTSLRDTGESAAGRADLERQIFGELGLAGSPDAAIQRSAEQAARARGAARGNILGDSSALQESLGVQLAQRQLDAQRRNDALSLLQSGQGTSDTSNRLQLAQQQSDIAGAGFNNSASQQQYSNLRNNAEFNNAASQQDYQNRMSGAGFNNAAAQQDFANQGTRAGFNNDANNQSLSQLFSAIGMNNATGSQDLANRQSAAGFNNANSQQGLQNRMAATAFNNEAGQQDFSNRGAAAEFNNATAQQSFANSASAAGQNNDAAGQAFQNAMNAINQRNQSKQNTFGAQQGVAAQRAGGRQQDLANVQSFLGLQPVVSQGAQLSGLQQGAAPFMQNAYSGTNINPNAGQLGGEWAGQLYGAQSQFAAGQAQAQAAKGAGTMGAVAGVAAATAPYWAPVAKAALVAF